MIKNGIFIVGVILLLSGCSLVKKKEVLPVVLENNITAVELNSSVAIEKHTLEVEEKPQHLLEMVFSGANGRDDYVALIESLDIVSWEKEALHKAYQPYKPIWKRRQKEDFKEILEEDRYLSICGDKNYYDNLMLVENKSQEDILYSLLLLRYLSNLSDGCLEWVKSDGLYKNDYREEHIKSNYLLSMLPAGVLISRLFLPYQPKEESFLYAVYQYKKLEKKVASIDALKEERLKVEQLKVSERHPDYN